MKLRRDTWFIYNIYNNRYDKEDSAKLKNIKDYREHDIYEPDIKIDYDYKPNDEEEEDIEEDVEEEEIDKKKFDVEKDATLQTILESKTVNRDKSRKIVTYLNCEIQSKDAEDNEKYSTIGERTDYLNNVLNDGNKPSALMLFFCGLFETLGRNNIQSIAGLDNTRFIVNWNNGNPIMRNYNPLSYLGSKVYNIYDSDDTVKDRIYRKQKDNTSEITLDEVENINDKNLYTYIKETKYDDERLNNYIYLPDESKLIMMLLADNYTREEIIQILYNKYNIKLSKSQLRTKIKHIAKQLKNPITVVDKRTKKCCMCGEEKNITEFSKDKSKKDGYSPRCKQCDKERKKYKNKVGNLTKTA